MSSKSRDPGVLGKATLPAVRGIDLLRARYAVGEHLLSGANADPKQIDSWVRATSETLQRVFGEDTTAAEFSSVELPDASGTPEDAERLRFVLETRLAVLEGLIARAEELYAEPLATHAASKRVFLVPGRESASSQAVIDFLESIECTPIVGGRSGEPAGAIEALDKHQDVGFGIVMLTGEGSPDGANDELLELGVLLGKLGRSRVCVVRSGPLAAHRYDESVLSVELDDSGEWQDRLVKALRDAGIT